MVASNLAIASEMKFSKVKHQFLAIICANIVSLSHGCILGWLSPYLPLLQSSGSPLESGPVSLVEASWIGAIICVGGVVGNFTFGLLSNYLGCKRAISCLAFPQVGFWTCIIFGKYVYHLYAARIFAGMTGGGIYVCIPLFVAEIADDHIRGTLGSLLLVNSNVGVLLAFIAGAYVDYSTIPYVMISLPIVFFVAFACMPDTPQYLLSVDKVKEAERALRFYKNCSDDTMIGCQKFTVAFERMKAAKMSHDLETAFRLADLCTPAARRGLLIGVSLMVINQFSGCFALVNYSATIFRDSGSDINPHMSSIILAAIQVAGTYTSTLLVDKLGRRVLLITSAAATSAGLTVMGVYSFLSSHLEWEMAGFSWVPVTSLSFVIFIASIGILPLPFVVLAEVLPQNIRAIGSTLCVTSVSCISFLILKTFPVLSYSLGLYGCMWIFATVCGLGTVFIAVCVEETKGKSLDGSPKSRAMSIF